MEQDLYGLQASGIDPEIAAQMLGLKRKRSVADALMQQALSPLKADRVAPGGLAVPISPWEGIAQLAKAYMGSKGLEDLDKQQTDLAKQNQAKVADAYANFQLEKNGMPAAPMTTAVDDEGNTNPMVPAVEGNPRAAVEKALLNPLLANNPLIAAEFKNMQPFNLKADESRYIPDAKGNIIQSIQAPKTIAEKNDPTIPNDWKQQGQTQGLTPGDLPGTFIAKNPETGKPELFKGKYQNGRMTEVMKLDQSTRVNVPVSVSNSTEKKYGEHFGAKVAEQDVAMRDAALKAPELAKRANDVIALLDDPKNKPYIGTGANFKAGFDKALTSAGITDESGRAVTTETLSANLAGSTLDAIKGSGLGAGNGFSNADRDFLEKVVGGKITLEEGTIRRLAQIHHRVAELTAGRWNDRVKTIPKSSLEGTGLTADPIQVPAFGGQRRRASDNPASQQIFNQADAILGGR